MKNLTAYLIVALLIVAKSAIEPSLASEDNEKLVFEAIEHWESHITEEQLLSIDTMPDVARTLALVYPKATSGSKDAQISFSWLVTWTSYGLVEKSVKRAIGLSVDDLHTQANTWMSVTVLDKNPKIAAASAAMLSLLAGHASFLDERHKTANLALQKCWERVLWCMKNNEQSSRNPCGLAARAILRTDSC